MPEFGVTPKGANIDKMYIRTSGCHMKKIIAIIIVIAMIVQMVPGTIGSYLQKRCLAPFSALRPVASKTLSFKPDIALLPPETVEGLIAELRFMQQEPGIPAARKEQIEDLITRLIPALETHLQPVFMSKRRRQKGAPEPARRPYKPAKTPKAPPRPTPKPAPKPPAPLPKPVPVSVREEMPSAAFDVSMYMGIFEFIGKIMLIMFIPYMAVRLLSYIITQIMIKVTYAWQDMKDYVSDTRVIIRVEEITDPQDFPELVSYLRRYYHREHIPFRGIRKTKGQRIRKAAIKRIGEIGSPITPYLISALPDSRSELEKEAITKAFVSIGEPVISTLIKELTNKYRAVSAEEIIYNTLIELGEASILALLESLKQNHLLVEVACNIIRRISEEIGESVILLLLQALRDSEDLFMHEAITQIVLNIMLMGVVKQHRHPFFPILIKALGDDNPVVCQTAIRVLVTIGNAVVPDLIKATRSEDSLVSQRAVEAISRIIPYANLDNIINNLSHLPISRADRRMTYALIVLFEGLPIEDLMIGTRQYIKMFLFKLHFIDKKTLDEIRLVVTEEIENLRRLEIKYSHLPNTGCEIGVPMALDEDEKEFLEIEAGMNGQSAKKLIDSKESELNNRAFHLADIFNFFMEIDFGGIKGVRPSSDEDDLGNTIDLRILPTNFAIVKMILDLYIKDFKVFTDKELAISSYATTVEGTLDNERGALIGAMSFFLDRINTEGWAYVSDGVLRATGMDEIGHPSAMTSKAVDPKEERLSDKHGQTTFNYHMLGLPFEVIDSQAAEEKIVVLLQYPSDYERIAFLTHFAENNERKFKKMVTVPLLEFYKDKLGIELSDSEHMLNRSSPMFSERVTFTASCLWKGFFREGPDKARQLLREHQELVDSIVEDVKATIERKRMAVTAPRRLITRAAKIISRAMPKAKPQDVAGTADLLLAQAA